MGLLVMNTSISTDYAAADDDTQIELRLGLSISKELGQRLSALIKTNQWETAAQLLADKYPQYRALLKRWFAASKARKTSEQENAKLLSGYPGN
ncbi:MAG: hypothetical protein JWP38_1694 [Herbaspirillum sp.]|jgi:hypothetical protein|nr:hypothetical protein [Herbaspirillum sp.]